MVQWLRLCAPNAGGPGSIPGQGNRSSMLQLRVHTLQLKILHATTNTWHTNIYTYVCVYIYVCVYLCIFKYVYICIYMCVYILYI